MHTGFRQFETCTPHQFVAFSNTDSDLAGGYPFWYHLFLRRKVWCGYTLTNTFCLIVYWVSYFVWICFQSHFIVKIFNLILPTRFCALGGALAGGVYRAKMGLRGILVGSFIGGLLIGLPTGSLLHWFHLRYQNGALIKSADNRRHLFYLKNLKLLEN